MASEIDDILSNASPDVQALNAHLRGDNKPLSRSKFNAILCTVDGIKFHSKKEAARYSELRILEDAGAITDLELQPQFELQEAFTDAQGKKHRRMVYTADFRYKDVQSGTVVVEEVKGGKATQTTAFVMRMKLFLAKYPEFEYRII